MKSATDKCWNKNKTAQSKLVDVGILRNVVWNVIGIFSNKQVLYFSNKLQPVNKVLFAAH